MQRYLHEAGYTTALLGKYLNKWPLKDPPPYFDRFAMGKHYQDVRFNVDGRMKRITKYVPDYLARKAVKLLRQLEANDEKPWFMMLTPSTPHLPALPAPRHENVRLPRWNGNPATNEKDLSDKPPMLYRRGPRDQAKPKRGIYDRMSRSLLAGDDLVDRVYQTMSALNESANTLAFFVSDNGFSLGEHGLIGKRKPYPVASRVPLYMRWPNGSVAKGIVDDRLVANIDVLPTVLGASELSPTAGHVLDGRSLRSTQERSRMLLEDFSSTRDHSWASLITDDEQYTEYYGDGGTLAFQEYYDVLSDPWRLTNTLGDDDPLNDPNPLTIQGLSDQLEADRECAGANCP